MPSTTAETIPSPELMSEEQIKAFEQDARLLFENARQPFGGIKGAGSVSTEPLERARYRTPEGELVTIWVNNTLPGVGLSSDTLAVTIEKPLPASYDMASPYLQENFIPTRVGGPIGLHYSLGVVEYYTPGAGSVRGRQSFDTMAAQYPEALEGFARDCTPAHLRERSLLLARLRPEHEIGCEPDPYAYARDQD